ncbi:hypothetical protein AMTR_s00142p00070800 [Amborella trichopoda]|uniref:Uncharacterized protein n=1 Tax=Amborella trichopoda TaxID=13333 RepID=W1PEI7_AMBTC|nr:hypothetical protein AMTR_s00142p00070800 [Amborella trichopoda]
MRVRAHVHLRRRAGGVWAGSGKRIYLPLRGHSEFGLRGSTCRLGGTRSLGQVRGSTCRLGGIRSLGRVRGSTCSLGGLSAEEAGKIEEGEGEGGKASWLGEGETGVQVAGRGSSKLKGLGGERSEQSTGAVGERLVSRLEEV